MKIELNNWIADLASWHDTALIQNHNDVVIAKILTKDAQGVSIDEMKANAMLVESAPELAACLKDMLELYAKYGQHISRLPTKDGSVVVKSSKILDKLNEYFNF